MQIDIKFDKRKKFKKSVCVPRSEDKYSVSIKFKFKLRVLIENEIISKLKIRKTDYEAKI